MKVHDAYGVILLLVGASLLPTAAAAQDFNKVLAQASEDVQVLYENPEVFARVSALTALDFQLKTAALVQEGEKSLVGIDVGTLISAESPVEVLWTSVYNPIFADRVMKGRQVDWGQVIAKVRDQLAGSYAQHYQQHFDLIAKLISGVTEETVLAIDAALLTTALVYWAYKADQSVSRDMAFVQFIDCIFWPFCF